MKKSALIIVFVFTFAVFANAQSRQQIAVHVPFDFYVQNQKMTAGDYLIESLLSQSIQSLSTLIIRDQKGKARGIMTTTAFGLNKDRKVLTPKLLFNRYGEEYVLAEIINPLEGSGFAVKASKTERYLAKQFGKPAQETIASSLKQK